MPRKKDTHEYTWKDLDGHIAPAVLCAPRTGGDPTSTWPQVHPRVIGYVFRHVVGKPWADHLVLIAAVCAAQCRDVYTIEQVVSKLHVRFSSLFPFFELTSVHQWSIDQHLVPYVRGAASSQDPLATRVDFFKRYMSATNLVTSWLDCLPVREQEQYRYFLLPTINPFLAEEFAKLVKEADRQQKEQRKQETEAVVPQFTQLRAEAHFRFNRMTRLWQAYQQALAEVLPDHSNLPLEFSYEEGEPPVERIVCRLWDRRSFVLHPDHVAKYHENTVRLARKKRHPFTDERNDVFLEYVKAERLEGNVSPEGLWFTDLLKLGMLGFKPRTGTEQEVAKKQAWLRQWGYGEDNPQEILCPFASVHPGLLAWPETTPRERGRKFHRFRPATNRWSSHPGGIALRGNDLWPPRVGVAHHDRHAHYVEYALSSS